MFVVLFTKTRREAEKIHELILEENEGCHREIYAKRGIRFATDTVLIIDVASPSVIRGCSIDAIFFFHVHPNMTDSYFSELWSLIIPLFVTREHMILRWFTNYVRVCGDYVYLNDSNFYLKRDEVEIIS